jgi:hypothetical protein
MNELGLKIAIAQHISKLRELAKDAEDFTIRLQAAASELEHRYRLLREQTNDESRTDGRTKESSR